MLQARTLERVAISFSNAWKWKVKVKSLSHVQLLETPWTAAYQAPPSMGFSRQEYWSGVPLPSPEHVPGQPDIKEYYKIKIMEIVNTWPMLRQEGPFNGTESQKLVGCPQQSLGPWLALSTGDSQAAKLVVIRHSGPLPALTGICSSCCSLCPFSVWCPIMYGRERPVIWLGVSGSWL